MVRHSTHSIDFKRQVVQDYLAGETLQARARLTTVKSLATTTAFFITRQPERHGS
jgi:hypothetical protein